MPVAGKIYTKKVQLEGYDEEAYVTIITNPKADLWIGTDELDKDQRNFLVMSRVIQDWNFTDELGQKIAITPETVKSTLSLVDLVRIENEMSAVYGLSDSKKNS